MTIWYIYNKSNGVFMGSGTPYFDTEEFGSTELISPPYVKLPPIFNGSEWLSQE